MTAAEFERIARLLPGRAGATQRVAELQRQVAQAEERYQRCLHMTKPAEPESEAPTRESGG